MKLCVDVAYAES